jgi:hypothetical protein
VAHRLRHAADRSLAGRVCRLLPSRRRRAGDGRGARGSAGGRGRRALGVPRNHADPRLAPARIRRRGLGRAENFIVESGFQLGDIVAFLDEDGDLFHAAVYLADDLVFSKNGTSPVAPWVIMPIDRLTDFYRSRSSSPRLIYHRHGRL